jgi:hypothetical protein
MLSGDQVHMYVYLQNIVVMLFRPLTFPAYLIKIAIIVDMCLYKLNISLQ